MAGSVRSTYTKKPSEKPTLAEVQALIVSAVQPAVVSVRWALLGALLAIVLSGVALVVAVAK